MQQFFAKRWRTGPLSLGCSIDVQSLTLVEWGAVGPASQGAQRWAQEAWAPGKVRDQGIWHDPAQLGVAVQALWQRAGMRCRRLALGLPADRVAQQNLQIEAGLPEKDIRAQVNWRASQALALAWDEVAFDYRIESDIENTRASDSGDAIQVKWLACPMAVVQAARQMSYSARLNLRYLGVEPAHTPLMDQQHGVDPALLPQWHGACYIARQGAMA
jgi:Tfp pilus assembly PilM family ATPase